jgi:DNA end-binding protein Ku
LTAAARGAAFLGRQLGGIVVDVATSVGVTDALAAGLCCALEAGIAGLLAAPGLHGGVGRVGHGLSGFRINFGHALALPGIHGRETAAGRAYDRRVPRPIWSGAISFGLVNVPVKLFSAVSSKDVRFHQLDGKSKSRIRQKRVSAVTGEEVPFDDIVKAYEIAPDNYVTITPEELETLDPKATKTIDIEDFVDLDQIDPVYYERPYYLVPDKGGQKAYALLRNAMRESNKVGIARVVLRTKQYLAAIRPKDDALVMETMLFADEVNPLDELDLPGPDVDVTEREEKMARSLIDSLTTDFEPDKYRDEYRERVLELIEQKASGQEIVVEEAAEEAPRVVDLMAALEASLAAVKAGKTPETDKKR